MVPWDRRSVRNVPMVNPRSTERVWRLLLQGFYGTQLGFLEMNVARMVVEEVIQSQKAHHHTKIDCLAHARGIDRKVRSICHVGLGIVGSDFGGFGESLLLVVVVSFFGNTALELLAVESSYWAAEKWYERRCPALNAPNPIYPVRL
jgi:hypothetical protein